MGLLLCVCGQSALPMSPVTRGSTPRTGWRVCLGLRRTFASSHRRGASTRPLQSLHRSVFRLSLPRRPDGRRTPDASGQRCCGSMHRYAPATENRCATHPALRDRNTDSRQF